MERDIELQERITAPLQLVWEEMDSLEQILAKAPQAADYDIVPGGQRATATARLSWGPVKWAIDLEFFLLDVRPRERLVYAAEAPSMQLRFEATVDLAAIGETETKLDYRGHLELQHKMAGRMRGLFTEIVEEHSHGFVQRVKVKAEQRRLAQERLLR